MRIFQTQSMWDAKEGRWYEVFSVDGEQVSGEEYFRELETEQCLEDDEVDEYCDCCNCDVEDCKDFSCTCGENDCDCEVENGNVDDDTVFECDCPDCVEQRRIDALEYEEFCTCDYCTEEREQDVISEFLDMLFYPEGACRECIIEKFIDSLYTFKSFGIKEAKENMKEFLED